MIVKVVTAEPCPNCNLFISKSGGCQYMKCPKCTFEFCWLCLSHAPDHQHAIGSQCSPRTLAMYAPILLVSMLLLLNPVKFVLKPIFSVFGFIFSYIWYLLIKISPGLLQIALFYAIKYPNKMMKTSLRHYKMGLRSKISSILSCLVSIFLQILILGFVNQYIQLYYIMVFIYQILR